MESIDKKIVDSQLEELGVKRQRNEVTRAKETVPVRSAPPSKRRTSIMDDDFEGSWAPRGERRSAMSAKPKVVATERSNQWHKDKVCERLVEMAGDWKVEGESATMSAREFDQIVTTLATDFANAMEHAGLIYKTGIAPAILADMVSDFLTTQTKVRVGDRYFDVEVGK